VALVTIANLVAGTVAVFCTSEKFCSPASSYSERPLGNVSQEFSPWRFAASNVAPVRRVSISSKTYSSAHAL
jgi:hypothetical protein